MIPLPKMAFLGGLVPYADRIFRKMSQHKISQAPVPMRMVGPVRIVGNVVDDSVMMPLATYETRCPLCLGGARVATLAGGIKATLIDERMTRSILLEAEDASEALQAWQSLASAWRR